MLQIYFTNAVIQGFTDTVTYTPVFPNGPITSMNATAFTVSGTTSFSLPDFLAWPTFRVYLDLK